MVEPVTDLVRRTLRHVAPAAFLVLAALVSGCETSSTVSTGATPVKCQVSLGTASMMEAGGGNSSFSVTTQPECAWEATTSASWISGLSPASGQGNGDVAFRVAANEAASTRDGSIVVNGQSVVISQRAACRYTVTPANQNKSANGDEGVVNVATAGECAWTATTDADWIRLGPPLSGNGNGTVAFTVDRNTGALRVGGIVIGGQRVTVTQAPAPVDCNGSITPTSQSVGAAGGSGTINVSAPETCTWVSVSNASWIQITAGVSGSGNGVVSYTVAPNTGAARTGTLSIAGRAFTVTQSAGSAPPPACTYTIAPTSQNVTAAGGAGTVAVTANAGCTWTASSGATWITITSGASGTGSGAVAFTVAANTGAARSAALTIAGQTFTVTQDAAAAPPPCTYSISPQSQNVNANANTGSVAVTTGSACAWTAASNAAWLSITSGAAGTGNGSVGVSVAANTGSARSGTLTIAGQTFTVNQAAFVPPCSYSIAPTSQNFTALGGTGSVTVTTTAACAWTASSGAGWITITSGGSGTGSGSVGFAVAANTGGQRSGSLTIGGQTFTVNQAALVGPLTER